MINSITRNMIEYKIKRPLYVIKDLDSDMHKECYSVQQLEYYLNKYNNTALYVITL